MLPNLLLLCWLASASLAYSAITCNTSTAAAVPSRIFVLTDISNEPDDQESLVRLLAHADMYTVEGLVTTTSYWLNDTTYPDVVLDVISAYANVTSNLNAHSTTGFPPASYLRSKVATSHAVYGLAALDASALSSGATLLISAIDASPLPLYIQLWGGATVVAEVLSHIQRTRSSTALAAFTSRMRIYSISDQDDAGAWIRAQFPSIFYIASIHGFNMYGRAAWTGISGEAFYLSDGGGPDSSLVSKSYIATHFQRGVLGAKYRDVAYIMEGDSPSLLYSMPNGLNVPEHPEYGGWGGRYTLSDISGRSRHFGDTVDWVVGLDNQTHVSPQATVWRWRSAYQNEMAARMQWSVSADYASAVHPPVVSVNGSCGGAVEPLLMTVAPGEVVSLDASASRNPDRNGSSDGLVFEWLHYREVSGTGSPDWHITTPWLNFTCADERCMGVSFAMPDENAACGNATEIKSGACLGFHVVLSVTNGGETPMTRYKRVILDVVKGQEKRQRDEL